MVIVTPVGGEPVYRKRVVSDLVAGFEVEDTQMWSVTFGYDLERVGDIYTYTPYHRISSISVLTG